MKRVFLTIAIVAVLSTSLFAGQLINVSGASGIALDGYDPVAFLHTVEEDLNVAHTSDCEV